MGRLSVSENYRDIISDGIVNYLYLKIFEIFIHCKPPMYCVSTNVSHLMFDNNFGTYGPIFKILSLSIDL